MRVAHQRAWFARLFLLWGALLGGLCALCGAEMPKVIFVPVDEATADFFDDPPSPLDYAAFLKSIQKHEPRCVGVVDLLYWPQVAPAILNGLISQAKPLNVVYAAMLDNDASDPDITKSLSAFPQSFMATGDLSALASFKSVPRLPDQGLLENNAAGFTVIDFGVDVKVTASGIEVPLIARGPNSELALSLPLLIAGQALGISWETVSIDIGTAMQLSDSTQPIPLSESGHVVLPLGASLSLQRLAGDRLIAMDVAVVAARDAVLIIGSDLERDRVFTLSDGQRVSRAELVSRTVCYLLEQATKVSPLPEPVPEVTAEPPVEIPDVVTVDKLSPSISPSGGYHFPDLRAPIIGLLVFGVSGGLAFGCLLLSSKPKRESVEPKDAPKVQPKREAAKSEITKETDGVVSLTKKRENSSEDQVSKKEPEESSALRDDVQAGDRSASNPDQAVPPKRAKKRPASKKRTRSQRRRPY